MNAPHSRIVRFLRRRHVMTLATCGAGGEVWCASVFYVYMPEHNIFIFATDAETRHGREAAANPQVAATIADAVRAVGRIKGVQICGDARRLNDNGAGFAEGFAGDGRKAYLRRFPYAALMRPDLWFLEPRHIKFTDNRLGFGKKLSWDRQ